MADIAIVVSILSGRIHSSFEMASRLEKEGHKITFLCFPQVVGKVENQGFNCIEIPEFNFYFEDPKRKGVKKSWIKKLVYHFKNFSNYYEDGKKLARFEEYKSLLNDLKLDHILIDVEIHDIIFPAFALNIPVTLYHTWFSDKISLNTPPIRSNIIPGKGLKGSKLGILFAWVYNRSKVWARVYVNVLTFKNYRRFVFKKYAKEIGFPKKGLMTNTLPPLFSFTKLPILTMAIKELEFPHIPAKNLIYVGPMVYENRNEKNQDSSVIQRVEEIFLLKKESNKRLIYCSVSSFVKGDIGFLNKVITAVSKEPDWILILALGGNLSPETFQSIPDNVYVFDWAPQLKILQETDCSINHGGINSINECVHYAVPMLVYSGKKFDQNGNAARVHYHGIGIMGDKDKEDSKEINTNIHRILEEQTFKDKMDEVNRVYQTYREQELTPFIEKH